MTPRELQALIQATPACAPYAYTADMPKIGADEVRSKDQAVADVLNAAGTAKRLQSRQIGYGEILNELGPAAGAALLDKLDAAIGSNSMIKWAMKLVEAGTFDIGLSASQAQIEALRGALLTDGETDGLKAMGYVPEIVSSSGVSIALRGPWVDE